MSGFFCIPSIYDVRKAWMYLLVFFLWDAVAIGAPSNVVFLSVCVNSRAVRENKEGEEDNWIPEAQELERAVTHHVGSLYPVKTKTCHAKNATKKTCLDCLKWVAESVTSKSLAIIYLDAHGGIDLGGVYYLCLADGYLSSKEIKDSIGNLPCQTILIVDTCHAGGMIDDWGTSSNTFIYAVCRTEESAYYLGWVPYFVKSLKEADYDKDGFVDSDEIATYVEWNVKRQTPRSLRTFKVRLSQVFPNLTMPRSIY
jgi:hypothetical protein